MEKLTAAFAPVHLETECESHKHSPVHGPEVRACMPGCFLPLELKKKWSSDDACCRWMALLLATQAHFRVLLVSSAFSGLAVVERHRLVNSALAEELAGPVHALALTLRTPEQ